MTDWLLDTLIATSGLMVMVLVLREPVRRRFGSRVAYGLWLIPAARLLMPPLTYKVERAVPDSASTVPLTMDFAGEPMLLAATATPDPTLLDQLGGSPALLLTVWLGVALALFVNRAMAFRSERASILAQAVQIARLGSIRIVRSSEVKGPLAFGIIDRVIAVPADFDRKFDDQERRLALDHELAHHRSGDLIANLFAFVLLCFQWFNPLAWIAHAAFRFDQEAACDARVLDKAKDQDRAGYGRTIAKAASGRALLFASALDQRKTLHRRLESMLHNPSAARRLTGRLIILAGVAAALPLTATWAIEYVDVAAPIAPFVPLAPVGAAPPIATVSVVAAAAAQAAAAPEQAARSLDFISDDQININRRTEHWRDLTPGEKADIRQQFARARQELSETKVDRAEIERDVREALAEARADHSDVTQDLAEAKVDIAEAMAEIDANAVYIRRSGQDPEQLKATVRSSLNAVESIDIAAIKRQALASIDPAAIAASAAMAEAAIRAVEEQLDRVEQQLDTIDSPKTSRLQRSCASGASLAGKQPWASRDSLSGQWHRMDRERFDPRWRSTTPVLTRLRACSTPT